MASPPTTTTAVQTVDVTKVYRVGHTDYPALKGVSLRIEKGELVSIMGPSGSGKSTLLNLIGALDRPTSGKVFVDGIDLRKLGEDKLALLRNRKLGFVYQTFNLIQRLTAQENVEMPLISRGMPEKVRRNKATAMPRPDATRKDRIMVGPSWCILNGPMSTHAMNMKTLGISIIFQRRSSAYLGTSR
jgi:ABC-type lipoprotein export system ATPase subunit